MSIWVKEKEDMADNLNKIDRKNLLELVNSELKIFFDRKIDELDKKDSFFIEITKDLKEYTLRGGKRIRPIFLIYSYGAFGNKIGKKIIKLSIFLELIQSSLLIHDDIMDQDALRRGGITIHEKYSKYLKKIDRNFGNSIAIIIGDLAMNFAYEIIADSNFSDANKIEVVKLVSRFISQVDYGQSMDVKLSMMDKFTKQDVDSVHYYKTMIYTSVMPLKVGAILGGADMKELKYIEKYANNVGLAFQIQDDIMGLFGDEKKIGKPIGSDIKENKKTLLVLHALDGASSEDKKYLRSKLGNDDIDIKDIEKIRDIVKKTGAYDNSRNLAENMVSEAINSINNLKIDNTIKEELKNIAKYIVTRNK